MHRTKKVGLLGYPIDHSLSPRIHNCAYRELGLNWRYELYPCADKAAFLQALAQAKQDSDEYLGFNVTTPYKLEAYGYADAHLREAKLGGSANVLSLHSLAGRVSVIAANTDGKGLVTSLKAEGNCKLEGATVVLCGGGAVARSALLALADEGTTRIFVACRDTAKTALVLQKVSETARSFEPTTDPTTDPFAVPPADPAKIPFSKTTVEIIDIADAELVKRHLSISAALIDTTSLGMKPKDPPVVAADALHTGLAVLDVVYGHGETALLKAARACGAKAVDGLGMLVEQAALTIEIWAAAQNISLVAPRDLMRKAASSL